MDELMTKQRTAKETKAVTGENFTQNAHKRRLGGYGLLTDITFRG